MGKLGKWLLLGLAALGAGCSKQDTERLARVGRRLAAGAEALTADARAGVSQSWQGLGPGGDGLAIAGRVAARLRWDRDLADLGIKVEASGVTVELQGKVRDLAQRRRAVELAETTAGVEKVNDRLQISER